MSKFWLDRPTPVTGATGLVRSWTVHRLLAERAALLERVLGEYEIDTVLHLAAQTLVPVAKRNPVATFETNIAGTWRLVEACQRSPLVRQIVTASTDKAYGRSPTLPHTETRVHRGGGPAENNPVLP